MTGDLGANIARWIARVLGLFLILFFFVFFIGEVVVDGGWPKTLLDILAFVLMFLSLAGMALAWFRERTGALLVLGATVAFLIVGLIRWGNPGPLLMVLLPALVGGLHLLSSQLRDQSLAK